MSRFADKFHIGKFEVIDIGSNSDFKQIFLIGTPIDYLGIVRMDQFHFLMSLIPNIFQTEIGHFWFSFETKIR